MKKENSKKLLQRFRMMGIAEGISFLVLLFIAMPLKYFMQVPEAVKIVGWIHGALFIAFIYLAFEVMGTLKKDIAWFAKAFVAAIIPFGTFIFDRQLKLEASLLKQ
jgi:integral membrane protein